MKGIIIVTLSCLLALATAGFCQDEEGLPPEWVFDDEEEIQNWGAPNHLVLPLELDEVKDKKGEDRTIVRLESTGGDPYVFPGGAWAGFDGTIGPFDGNKYTTIFIGIRADVANTWQIYYMTDEDGAYSERQRQNFQVAFSDDFLDLEFVMEEGGWQDEMITGFRIDPGTAAGVVSEIDYLSLRGIPEGLEQAVEYNGKLAVTWGTIKR